MPTISQPESMAPTAPPICMNPLRAPLGMARCVGGNHLAIAVVEAGKMPACVIPIPKRTATREPQPPQPETTRNQ